jgi:hypothetical protein
MPMNEKSFLASKNKGHRKETQSPTVVINAQTLRKHMFLTIRLILSYPYMCWFGALLFFVQGLK